MSVLIPAHNEQEFIAQCIRSVIATGWPPDHLEILVIDHQSTDSTAAIAREAGATVLTASANNRIGAVRNVGLKAANGAYVAFVDADCTVPKTWLSTAIPMLASHPKIGAIGGSLALSPTSGTLVERSLAPTHITPGLIAETNSLRTSSFIAPTRLLRDLGNFSELVMSGEDDDISNRIRLRGCALIAASDCCVIHHGFAQNLPELVRKEIWHGSNHIDVRSSFDRALALTLLFIAASTSALLALCCAPFISTILLYKTLTASLIVQLISPALFAAKRLKHSGWHWRLAPFMIVVGYAFFFGHGIGVLRNATHRVLLRNN